MDDFKTGHAITVAPLVVKDKVIVGNSGGDLPTRGFLDAYDPRPASALWRFYTIPAAGEPGSETWPDATRAAARRRRDVDDRQLRPRTESDLLGNRQSAIPITTATIERATTCTQRRSSRVDADTGKLKWHFQFTPHDTARLGFEPRACAGRRSRSEAARARS